jgi:hypothetical protein
MEKNLYNQSPLKIREEKMSTEGLTEEEMDEVKKIQSHLESGEQVLLVARQSRLRPGGSIATPNIIFATDRKLIIRNPTMLGLRESVEAIPYSEITSVEFEKGVFSNEIRVTAPGLTSSIGRFFQVRHGVAGIPAIPEDKAKRLIEIVREGMKRAKAAKAVPSAAVAPTPLEELKKLKELLDIGAITQEEYEEKKKKILEKI